MIPYANISGRSGVSCFKTDERAIHVRFKGGVTYVYEANRIGAAHVMIMKELAHTGKGLCTYITRKLKQHDHSRKYVEHEPMVQL